MGMFDEIKCKYPLPVTEFQNTRFQTKDTPAQACDLYEIREDGTLWYENYDQEDQSERGIWIKNHPDQEPPEELKGLRGFIGCGAKVNRRWEQVIFTGEICFYEALGKDYTGWIEFSAYFENGKVVRLNLIAHKNPD